MPLSNGLVALEGLAGGHPLSPPQHLRIVSQHDVLHLVPAQRRGGEQ